MGKLKEKLINNLTSEELDDLMGDTAFDFVEYMAPQLETQSIEDVNDSIKPKYSDGDIEDVIKKLNDGSGYSHKLFQMFLSELKSVYLSKMGHE